MGKNVVLIGTMDTKGVEFAYVRDRLRDLGLDTTVVDVGILGDPLGIEPDIDHAEVARHGPEWPFIWMSKREVDYEALL